MSSVACKFPTYSSLVCLLVRFHTDISKWGTYHDYVLQWIVPTINQMAIPIQMLFLRGSVDPISAPSELRSTLSHYYKTITSSTGSVDSCHEQIYIVRLLFPGGAMAYVSEFCRVVVGKSCRGLPLFGVSCIEVLLNPPLRFRPGGIFRSLSR